jgi:iron complex outermembrane receptor protein
LWKRLKEEADMLQPRLAILVWFALTTLSATPTLAQPSAGKIAGTVGAANGAPIAGAAITITNQETGAARVVRSSATGAYEAADLPPGLYTVSADIQGFRKVIQRDRRLDAGATLTVDFGLQLRVTEDITVTAMKREDTVSNTPVSIAAPTEETLRARGVENIEGVAANVADFSVQNLGPGQSQVSMRGVSSGQIARDQPGPKEEVGAYLDESVISFLLFTPDIDLFDMNRIEVLRGPQGTLFGSGSLSGTVRYISNQPELGVSSSFGEFTANSIDSGGVGGNAKVGLNAPLGSKAALRAVAYYDHLAGYMDAVQPNLSVKKDVNGGDRLGARIALEFAPDENLTIIPRFFYQKVTSDGWNRIDNYNILANPFTTTRPAVTLGDRQLFTQVDEPYHDKFSLGDLSINYNFGDVLLTSVTSYTHRDIDVVRDAGALTSSITGGSYGAPEVVYTLDSPLDDHTTAHGWTEELRLSGGKGRFKWVAGGFYADATKIYGQNLSVKGFEDISKAYSCPICGVPTTGLLAPKDSLFFSNLNYKTRQYAFFGEGTLAVSDKFSFTAGLRYYNYKDDKTGIFDGIFTNNNTGTSLVTFPGTTSADGVAPRFIASYKVSDSTTLNAQASKGFRLGGLNDPLNIPLCSPEDVVTFGGRDAFKDETAWNYEIGSKSRIMGGRGSVSATGFYVDIKDLQVVVTAGQCSSRLVFNVPKARSVGGELEFALAPTDHFDFAVSASYNDSTLRSSVTEVIDGTTSIVAGIEEGKRLPSVPNFQMALSATYQQPLAQGFNGYISANYQHVGSRITQVGDDQPGVGTINLLALTNTIGGPLTQTTFSFNPILPAYDIVNLRLGVRHGIWEVAFFVNNLTDERAFLALDRERGLLARQGFLTNQPRTFGLTSRFDF